MRTLFILSATVVLSNVAFAFGSTGPFVGDVSDSFETYPDYFSSTPNSLTVLGGAAEFTASYPGLWVISPSTPWGLGGNGLAYANTGNQALGLFNNSASPVSLVFDTAMQSVGAYWQTVDEPTGGPVNLAFYDADNNLLGTDSFAHSSGDYVWHGWTSAAGIKTIVMQGNLAPVMDDLQASAPVPEPGTLAALGLGVAALRRRRK